MRFVRAEESEIRRMVRSAVDNHSMRIDQHADMRQQIDLLHKRIDRELAAVRSEMRAVPKRRRRR